MKTLSLLSQKRARLRTLWRSVENLAWFRSVSSSYMAIHMAANRLFPNTSYVGSSSKPSFRSKGERAAWPHLEEYTSQTPDVGLSAVVAIAQQNLGREEARTAAEIVEQPIGRCRLGAQPKVHNLHRM
jgi:hypothetical protein